jgi:hypothetical protein
MTGEASRLEIIMQTGRSCLVKRDAEDFFQVTIRMRSDFGLVKTMGIRLSQYLRHLFFFSLAAAALLLARLSTRAG